MTTTCEREQELLQQEVLGTFDPRLRIEEFIQWRMTESSISLVYRKGLQLNGANPTLLYAYGSYGYSIDPVSDPQGSAFWIEDLFMQ